MNDNVLPQDELQGNLGDWQEFGMEDLCDLDPWYGDSLLKIWNFEAGFMDATIKTVIGTMPFNVNRRHWLALSAWDKKQAALLVLGIEPGEFHHIDSHLDYLSMCKPLIQLMQLMPDNLTKPLDWLIWFDGNGYMEYAPPWLCRWFKEQSEAMSNVDRRESDQTKEWKVLAWELGEMWMNEQRGIKEDPGVDAIAKHVEAEFKRKDIRGKRDDYLRWNTIKKEALTGITGKKANGK